MALAGVGASNTEVSNLLGTTAFAANRTIQNVQEQLKSSQIQDFRKTDFVDLSDKALQLSREALTPGRTAKETKQE